MSGRVADLEVNPDEPTEFYVAYASGGLWHTTDNGISFEPLFEREASMTLGDIAVDWRTRTIWLGTGENNSSRSSYAGTGLYKSSDMGKTWQHLGLADGQHTGRILLHPTNTQTAWVAMMGHLYSPNAERGIFKTTDGGVTWRKTLFINDSTGVIDLVINPKDPNILYAAAWERTRHAWHFQGNGSSSGIYKSTDGGESWSLMTEAKSGFPNTKGLGRIGIALAPSQPETLYAVLDNQDLQEKKKPEDPNALTKERLKNMGKDEFLKLDEDKINDYLDENGFPEHITAESVKDDVRTGKIQVGALVEYLEDANALLFDTPVKGLECYRSDDGGNTWRKTHEGNIDMVVYSYGYYFGQVRVDAQKPEKIYTLGVPIITSENGGKDWKSIGQDNVHVDHHALWANPKRPGHLVSGNDGGINITYDDGQHWFKANSPPVGQVYAVNVDMAEPYNVYCGFQDNGVWKGPSTYELGSGWQATGHDAYKGLMGGDGMQIEIDTRDNQHVITGYQFGNYFNINTASGKTFPAVPRPMLGERPFRFNWQTPIHLSRHNRDILYMGSNKFHRSFDQGKTWETLSDDLTKGGQKGNVPYGTLTSIHESPLRFGLIYVGTDDGLAHRSADGGYTWQRISDGLPQDYWVSRVQASAHSPGRVFVSLNGYRWDNFEALAFVSEDFGKTWQQIGRGLPAEPINVIKEDPTNPSLLYVGTDHGLYVSLDKGAAFTAWGEGMPDVPVHDLVIHPRDADIIVGTHGRSLFKASVAPLQQLTPERLKNPLIVFEKKAIRYSKNWGMKDFDWVFHEPKHDFYFYAKYAGHAEIRLKTQKGTLVQSLNVEAHQGLNRVELAPSVAETNKAAYERELGKSTTLKKADNGLYYLLPGTYVVEVAIKGTDQSTTWEIRPPEVSSRKKKKKIP
jgi:photosystem II stability/assembly factor-like uncharacterized protein